MQGYFLSGVRTGLIIVAMAMTFCFSAVPGAVAGDCGADPTVTVDAAAQDVIPGDSIDYIITINSASDCNVDIAIADSNGDFTSTQPGGTPLPVTTGDNFMTLTVAAAGTTNISESNTTTLIVNGDGNAADFEVQLTTTANNPLLHNSFNLGSGKWVGQGGWGVAGGKYGKISCDTCHAKSTGNIKRVVSTLPNAPDTSKGNFPGAGQPVNLQSTTGVNSFGDDSSAHATSNRICEVCHTYDVTVPLDGVKFHAYNMGVTANHENQNDCISCHAHNTGFAASCTSCHGDGGTGKIWPDGIDNNGGRVAYADDQAGAHDNHIAVISQELFGMDEAALLSQSNSSDLQIAICAFCHVDPGGGGHDADGGGDSMVDLQPAGSFEMFTVGAGNHAADTGSGAYNFTNDSCSNLVCHNQVATPSGGNDWNNPPASVDCTLCHAANGGSQRHDTHVGSSSFACTECHVNNGTFDSGTSGVDHINGDVDLVWTNAGSYEADFGDSSVTYSGTAAYKDASWGTCSSVACHSNSVTPAWNATGAGCTLCHSGTETTGSHQYHMHLDGDETYGQTGTFSDVGAYDFGCADCHGGDTHVNGSTVVSMHGFDGSKSCATADCHSHKANDGVTTVYAPTPAWGTSFSGDRCAGCHGNSPESAGHEEHQMGFHSEHVYSGKKDFLPVRNSDPLPANLVLGPADNGDADSMDDSYDPIRGHGGVLADGTVTSTIFTCYVCHNATVNAKPNDQATLCKTCHDDTVAPLMGDMVVADKSFHVNGVNDVVFVNEAIRSKAQVRDELMDVPELSENWTRVGVYKANDGSSYDEQPKTLDQMAVDHGGWDAPSKTCTISCHLWEAGRVDKYPVHWIDNSRYGAQTLMCIDCHTRLPK
jgi:predicted CxxxxCH...CXXCH cytochrome family protein